MTNALQIYTPMPSTTAILLLAVLAVRHGVEHLLMRWDRSGQASGRVETLVLGAAYTLGAGAAVVVCWDRDPGLSGLSGPGWTVLGAGVLLRFWSRRALGRFYSYDTLIREDHRLVDTGPYALCRHPLSTAMLAEGVGFALLGAAAMDGPWSWCLAAPAATLAVTFGIRNRREEQKLTDAFGEPYDRYGRSVPGMNLVWGVIRFGLRGGRTPWRSD